MATASPRQWINDYPLLTNLTIDPRLLGFPAVISPGHAGISSSRMKMHLSHFVQSLVLEQCEPPLMMAGWEPHIANYTIGTQPRREDAEVIAIIPMYPQRSTQYGTIRFNPRTTIIFRGVDTGILFHQHVDTHTAGKDGFGWANDYSAVNALQLQRVVPRDIPLVQSKAHVDGMYGSGLNLNVAYMELPEVDQDAVVISRSAAERMAYTAIGKISINVAPDLVALNTYGTDEDPRCMPDIGEYVNENGVVLAFRRPQSETFMADTAPDALRTLQPAHDIVYPIPPGSQIVGVDVIMANPRGEPLTADPMARQLYKYHEAKMAYYERIIAAYQEQQRALGANSTRRLNLDPSFLQLVRTAMMSRHVAGEPDMGYHLGSRRQRVPLMERSREEITHMRLEITYATRVVPGAASKLSDRTGTKGVCCMVMEDADMPIDEQGIRADYILSPKSNVQRMNPSQLIEQSILRAGVLLVKRLKAANTDYDVAFNTFVEFLADINPAYAALVKSTLGGSLEDRVDYVKRAYAREALTVLHPPHLNTTTGFRRVSTGEHLTRMVFIKGEDGTSQADPDVVTAFEYLMTYVLRPKWGYVESPVAYTFRHPYDPNYPVCNFKTVHPVAIGPKYVYLLGKIASSQVAAPGIPRISHAGMAVRTPPHARVTEVVRGSPTRAGEDELRALIMDVGADNSRKISRWTRLLGSSSAGITAVARELLRNPSPTNITQVPIDDETLYRTSGPHSIVRHLFQVFGVDIGDTLTTEDPEAILATLEHPFIAPRGKRLKEIIEEGNALAKDEQTRVKEELTDVRDADSDTTYSPEWEWYSDDVDDAGYWEDD